MLFENSSPAQLTAAEVATTEEMVTSDEYRHVSLRGLSLLAGRLGKVFSSASTWCKLVRERGWRRPRRRLFPEKPQVGIRATAPNQYWHLDVTVIKLLDGKKVYLHGVIDNYSRRILAWQIATSLTPGGTCDVLREAARSQTVVIDSGVENVNHEVSAF